MDDRTRLISIRTVTAVAAVSYAFGHEAHAHTFAGLTFLWLAVFFLRAPQP
jgi:hypothetical protein